MTFPALPESLSATPLAALPLVVMDTETTGLDPAQDRIIEIGAYRPVPGRHVEETDIFVEFVNPGRPIPAASTAIHGIEDADVSAAGSFSKVSAAFVDWAGSCVVVGYSIGFDMAILKAEHVRHDMVWRPPRCLDVRHLVALLAPNLPNPSLETAAGWLEIDVSNRHRALGDALVTGQVFMALIPKLRERGIVTLAQAERACRALSGQMQEEARAGWEGLSGRTDAIKGFADFARIDSFPYRHRVGDLMSAPPLTTGARVPVREALSIMMARKVSSLLVQPGSQNPDYGIVTERDILRMLDQDGPSALDQPVTQIASRPLVTVQRDEFVYRALSRMSGKGFRHLAVSDEAGAVVGVLSARDLLRQRADDAISLGDGIERAETVETLEQVWSDLTLVARALVYEGVDARTIASMISRELRALTERACQLAEQRMAKDGLGAPPVPYTMMVLGSGGRGESLLAMDQDNAIVYSEGGPDSPEDQWFESLGRHVADTLNSAGVCYCKGGIMASNAEWRMDAARWKDTVRSWVSRSRPEDILNCDIFFDAMPVHGQAALADSLRENAIAEAGKVRSFLTTLAMNAAKFDSPIGWFGRFKQEDGRVDLKLNGIMPIFSTARVAALQYGLTHRSTPARLSGLKETGEVSERTIDTLIEAHRILLNLILRQQLRDLDNGLPLSNKVAPSDLTELDRQEMRWALEQVPRVTGLLGTPVVG